MNTKTAAETLHKIAVQLEATGKLPINEVMQLVAHLEHGRDKTASTPDPKKYADHFRSLGDQIVASKTPPSRLKLAAHLRRLVADEMSPTSSQMAAAIYQQASSREEVMKGFGKANPSMTEAELEKAADEWEKNQNVVKDKH